MLNCLACPHAPTLPAVSCVALQVRAFVLMHDATHGALFSKRWMNQWTGIITGLMNAMDAPGEQQQQQQQQ